jgi:hypothetical protein
MDRERDLSDKSASIASEMCRWEVELTANLNKRTHSVLLTNELPQNEQACLRYEPTRRSRGWAVTNQRWTITSFGAASCPRQVLRIGSHCGYTSGIVGHVIIGDQLRAVSEIGHDRADRAKTSRQKTPLLLTVGVGGCLRINGR